VAIEKIFACENALAAAAGAEIKAFQIAIQQGLGLGLGLTVGLGLGQGLVGCLVARISMLYAYAHMSE